MKESFTEIACAQSAPAVLHSEAYRNGCPSHHFADPFKKGRTAAATELLFLKPVNRMKESVDVSSSSRIAVANSTRPCDGVAESRISSPRRLTSARSAENARFSSSCPKRIGPSFLRQFYSPLGILRNIVPTSPHPFPRRCDIHRRGPSKRPRRFLVNASLDNDCLGNYDPSRGEDLEL
jgi:hypothetical protein